MKKNYAYTARHTVAGPAWRTMMVALLVLLMGRASAQTYTMPTTGTTTVTTCSGTLYDNGGSAGSYSANANGSFTITPGTAGNKIKLQFTSFAVGYYDRMTIYDGSSTSSPVIGTYYDYYSPGTVYATNSAGTLTVRFATDYYVSGYSGFSADISCVTTVPLPDLSMQGTSVQPVSAVAGSSMTLYSSIYNLSGTTATSSNVGYYLSSDATLDASDVLLGNSTGSNLAVGGYSSRTSYVQLPANTAAGAYYVLFVADYQNAVSESNENNNVSSVYLNVAPSTVDLIIQQASATPTSTAPGNVLSLSCYITNQGNTTAAYSSVGYYLSTNTTLDANDQLLSSSYGGQLTTNYPTYRSVTTNVPPGTAPGTYYILFAADYQNVVSESNETNNVSATTVTIVAPNVDLIVSQASLSSYSMSAGTTISASASVYNQGNTAAASSNVGYYISLDATLSSGDVLLGTSTGGALSAGANNYPTASLTIPTAATPGTYYILFAADYLNQVTESSETNNVRSVAITVVAPSIDLVIQSAYLNSTTTTAGTTISGGHYITNLGNTTAPSSNVGYYLSTDATFSSNDVLLGTSTGGALVASNSATRYPTLTIPTGTAAGSYYVLFVADYQNAVAETNENNNVSSTTLTIVTPGIDLVNQSPSLYSSAVAAGNTNSGSHYIINQGTTTAASSNVGYYLSSDATLSSGDILLTSAATGTLSAGGYASLYPSFTVPTGTAPGSYYVLFVADYQNTVSETNENNNVSAVSMTVTAPNVDLVIQSASLSSTYVTAGSTISGSHYIVNQGSSAATSSNVGYFLSTDNSFSTNDYFLSSSTGGALSSGGYSTRYPSLVIPTGAPAGTYYVLFVADYQNSVAEINENNNVSALTLTVVAPGIDLVVNQPAMSRTSMLAGSVLSVGVNIVNQGNTFASTSDVGFYLSTDNTLSTNDVLLGSAAGSTLTAGGTGYRTTTFVVPASTTAGAYYVLFAADYQNSVAETNETNNVVSAMLTVTVPFSGTVVPASGTASITSCSTTVADNGGSGNYIDGSYGSLTINPATAGNKVRLNFTSFQVETCCDRLYIYDGASTNAVLLGSYTSNPGIITAQNSAGSLTLLFTSDGSVTDSGFEAAVSCVSVAGQQPDLIVQSPTQSATAVTAGATLTLGGTVRNQGVGEASGSQLGYYLSQNTTLDSNDLLLGTSSGGVLASGATAQRTGVFTVPAGVTPGAYYVIYAADPTGAVTESNEANNTASLALTVVAALPDLVVSSATLTPAVAPAGTTVSASCLLTNSGTAVADQSIVAFYLSTDNAFSPNDVLLGYVNAAALPTGAGNTRASSFTIPASTAPGNYYVMYVADAQGTVTESDEQNNVISRAFTVSVVTGVKEQLNGFVLNVYPNPATGSEFTVRMDGPSTGKAAQLELLNSIGQQVSLQTLVLTSGRGPVHFDTTGLNSGVYTLRVTGEDLNVTRRIVIE
jgi:subtilase family serine protease